MRPSARPQNPVINTFTFRSDYSQPKEVDYNTQLIENLKHQYHERILSLEYTIKETYNLVESDELISTMRLNAVSEDFSRQRVKEIVEDNLLREKEQQIEKLNDTIAYLSTEVKRLEDDSKRIEEEGLKYKLAYEDDLIKFQKSVAEFEVLLDTETKTKIQYKEEYENLIVKVNHMVQATQEEIAQRENQLRVSSHHYEAEIMEIREISEALKQKNAEYETHLGEKTKLADSLTRDMETLKHEFIRLEGNHKSATTENSRLASLVTTMEELKRTHENEIQDLKNRLRRSEEDLRFSNNNAENTQREKLDLLTKTEAISEQVKKMVEDEHRASEQMIDEVKRKYKTRLAEQKKKNDDLQATNDQLNTEISSLKSTVSDTKSKSEKAINQMQNDMKMIKIEWERKCQEIELNYQKIISESKAKHQAQVNQLQTEYQMLLDKKLLEIQTEAAQEINKVKTGDLEVRAQLEARLSQIEKDYILKTKHDNILTGEILSLKTKHAQEMKDLEDNLEREHSLKLRELLEKTKNEYEPIITNMKSNKFNYEQEIQRYKSEIYMLTETCDGQREKIGKLLTELEESEINRKELIRRLDEADNNISKLRDIFEDEMSRFQRYNVEVNESSRKINEVTFRNEELNEQIQSLRDTISNLEKDKSTKDEKITQYNDQYQKLLDQTHYLQGRIQELENNKEASEHRINSLKEELAQESSKIRDAVSTARREENIRLEMESNERAKIEARLSQADNKIRSLGTEVTEKDNKLAELKNTIARLETFINEANTKSSILEASLANANTQLRESDRKYDRLKIKTQDIVYNLKKFFSNKADQLREEAKTVKQTYLTELEKLRKLSVNNYQEAVNVYANRLQERLTILSDDKDRQTKILAREFEDKLNQAELLLKNSKLENENISKEVEALRNENRDLGQALDFSKARSNQLENELDSFKRQSAAREAEYESLTDHVNKETRKLKEESRRIIEESMYVVEENYSKELRSVLKYIDDLKEANASRLKTYEKELLALVEVHHQDFETLRAIYQQRLDAYERELLILENEYQHRIKEKEVTKVELDRLKQNYLKVRDENRRMSIQHQDRENIRDSIRIEEGKTISARGSLTTQQANNGNGNGELDKYRREMMELQKELAKRSEKIEELQKTREEQKSEFEKFKLNASEKEREIMKAQRNREKEIEELQLLLSKSLSGFTGALDNNMKMANKLDKETEELVRNVRPNVRKF